MVDLGPEITESVVCGINNSYCLLTGVGNSEFLHLSTPFPAQVMYSLEEQESQDHIAINLLPLLAKEMQHKGELPNQTKNTHRWVISLNTSSLIFNPFECLFIIGAGESLLCVSPPFSVS